MKKRMLLTHNNNNNTKSIDFDLEENLQIKVTDFVIDRHILDEYHQEVFTYFK